MKLSNLRIERRDGQSYLTCDMKAKFTDVNEIWFSVPTEHEKYLTDDVYDAFLVASIYPAMFYNEDVEIEGNVSQRLHFNVTRYVPSIVKAYRPEMHDVKFAVKGYAEAKQIEKGVGTGFSAGVDSFSTFVDHFVNESQNEYRISSLFFFNVGSHGGGGEGARNKFHARYELLKGFPEEIGLPYIPLDSNLFDFYQTHWEFDAGVFCRACAILVLQKCISKYYLSSTDSYADVMYIAFNPKCTDLAEQADVFLNPMLSTERLDIITDGAQYTRTQKTEQIAKYEPVQRYLNVCIGHWGKRKSATNCSICHKCLRTLIALESLGILEQYRKVFDIDKYKKSAYKYKCQIRLSYSKNVFDTDNVDFAIAHGNRIPSYLEAYLYLLPSKAVNFARRVVRKVLSLISGKVLHMDKPLIKINHGGGVIFNISNPASYASCLLSCRPVFNFSKEAHR